MATGINKRELTFLREGNPREDGGPGTAGTGTVCLTRGTGNVDDNYILYLHDT